MKKWLIKISLCFLVIFSFLILSQKAQAIVYFSENWDSGTPPSAWPCKNLPNGCTSQSFNGWAPKDYGCNETDGKDSGLSTTIYHSPPRSYYQKRAANQYSTCDIWKSLPQPYPTKIHMRFYVYFTNNWQNFDNPPGPTAEFVHLLFTNSTRSGVGFRFNLLDISSTEYLYECYSGTKPQMYLNIEDNSTGGKRGTAPYDCWNFYDHLNEWICVEIMADAENDKYGLWINGDMKVNNVTTTITQTNFAKIIISGFSSYLKNWTGDFYIDDIIVSDSYIGCGPLPQAPQPPANLRIVP